MNTSTDLQVGGEYGPSDERFILIEKINSGGMSSIWKAKDLAETERKGKEVIKSLKFLHHDLTANQANLKRLQREADNTKRLHHPNIVGVYGFKQGPDGHLFLVMDYLEGRDLALLLVEEGRNHTGLAWNRVKGLMTPAVKALHYAYQEHAIIHRDIKPDNIFLTNDNTTIVLDFGLSEEIKRSGSKLGIQADDRSGTKVYWAPEICQGAPLAVTRDIYAFTAVVYELLTDQPPYPEAVVCNRQENRYPPKPHQLDQLTWNELKKGLAYNPEDRPDDIKVFWGNVLNANKKESPLTTPSKKGFTKWLAVGSVGALVIAGAFSLNAVFNSDNVKKPIHLVATTKVKPPEIKILNGKQALKEEKQLHKLARQKAKKEADKKVEKLIPTKANKKKLEAKNTVKESVREKVTTKTKTEKPFNHKNEVVKTTSGSGRVTLDIPITSGKGRLVKETSYTSGSGKSQTVTGGVIPEKINKDDSLTDLEVSQNESYALHIDTIPDHTKVRILNIKPKYIDGIKLAPGKYHIEVSKQGYKQKTKWISLADGVQVFKIRLDKESVQTDLSNDIAAKRARDEKIRINALKKWNANKANQKKGNKQQQIVKQSNNKKRRDYDLIKRKAKEAKQKYEAEQKRIAKQQQIARQKHDDKIKADSLKKWKANEAKRKYEAEQKRIVEQQRKEKQRRDDKIRADAIKRWNAKQKQLKQYKQVQRVLNNEHPIEIEHNLQTNSQNSLSAIASSNTANSRVPENAVITPWVGRDGKREWKCKRGYRRRRKECEKIYVPPNAILSLLAGYDGNEDWVCKRGFEKVGNHCKKIYIPPNAKLSLLAGYSSDKKWVCKIGFEKIGNGCKKIYIPPNAKLSLFAGYDGDEKWVCNRGFVKVGNHCKKIYIPPNASFSEFAQIAGPAAATDGSWVCNKGYKKVSNGCIKTSR